MSLTLSFGNMSFSYEGAEATFTNINYTFSDSKIIKICATTNGKSTLLKILAGILPITNGEYRIDGLDVAQMSFEEFLPLRMRIGYGFDTGGLLNNKTILENILLPLQYHNIFGSKIEKRVQSLMARFQLERLQHLRPFAVPGSQRKAACLVRALAQDPTILILDEPDGGLKDEGVLHLCQSIEEGLESFSLQRVIYTSNNSILAKRLGPEEVWVEMNQFKGNERAA